jgi:DNA-binding NarL/FixJ family response regulator
MLPMLEGLPVPCWKSPRADDSSVFTSAPDGSSPHSQLTRREHEIFTHLGLGHTASQIATRLGLSVKTIEAHREPIKNKLGRHNAAQVTASASRWIQDFSIQVIHLSKSGESP